LPGRSLIDIGREVNRSEDRTVFSSVRGEADNGNLWRVAAKNRTERSYAEFDLEADEIVREYGDESLREELRILIRRLSETLGGKDQSDKNVNSAIEDRLSALGYK
jgi:hypothetical protein